MRRRPTGRTAGCYPDNAGSTPAVAASHTRPLGAPGRRSLPPPGARVAECEGGTFLGRLTAGSSALNRRMRGSNPARGAHVRTRPWRPGGLQPRAGEGSIPSVRASGPGLLVDRGCRPLKPATRVRIPLGALTRPWCNGSMRACHACGAGSIPAGRFNVFLQGALVLTGNTRGLHPWVRGSSPRGSIFLSP
jgi:hypothetical protein